MKKFSKISVSAVAVLVIAFTFVLAGVFVVHAVTPLTVSLGAADSFAILAGTPNITDVGGTTITGDVGLSPATGAGIGLLSSQVTGTIYAVDAAGPANSVTDPTLLTAAKQAITDAITDASGRTPYTTLLSQELGGATTTAGLYTYDSLQITGTSTLDAEGDPNAVFIFKSASTLTTAVGSVVNLVNGASACNVFWVVDSANGQLGADSTFKGTIMANTLIALGARANVEGRLLAFSGAVTLNDNVIAKPTCVTSATLTLVKNISGGTRSVADFPLTASSTTMKITGVSGADSITSQTVNTGTYTLSEVTQSDYTAGAWSCTNNIVVNGSNQITLFSGNTTTCTITNTYIPPVVSRSSGGGGGMHYGCKDLNALNYEYYAASNPALCLYAATSTPVVATTTVIIPKLPNTGFPPKEGNIPWSIVMLLGVFTLVSASSIVLLRKSKI